tara:strand:+ start:385 stop:717 length:333 start_codon:yes stop_codon:yes gene_type:complete
MDIFALLIPLAIIIAIIASYWVIYTKAGEAGWKCLIPIYNLIVILKIVNKPVWWIILILTPLVNLVIAIMVNLALAKAFGKGAGFGIGLTLLPFIFAPLLAFGDAEYISN